MEKPQSNMMTHFGTFYRLETGELTVFPPDKETPHTVHTGTLHRNPPGPWLSLENPFVVVCSWCESSKDEKGQWHPLLLGKADLQRSGIYRLSHGICPSCYETQMKKLQ